MRTQGIGAGIALIIATATLAVFAQVRDHEFLDYDDPRYVTENPKLRLGLSWAGLASDLREPYFGNWSPLTSLSLRIDHAAYGFDAAGYLFTNLALHIATTLVLLAALVSLTGALGRSAFVAAVFALHPLHVESVAWVSERKDVLSGLFFALTLFAYARYARGPARPLRMIPVALAFALGLLSKSMLVTLPFVLLLLDVWPLGRLRLAPFDAGSLRSVAFEKWPLFLLAIAMALVTVASQDDAGALFPVEVLPVGPRLANALSSYAVYLAQAFWPSGLAAFYPHPLMLVSPWRAFAAGGLLAGVSVVAIRSIRTRPYFFVGWAWYLGMLVPVIGIVQVGMQAHADRYTYLPLIGASIAFTWGAVDVVGRTRNTRAALAAVGVAASAAMAFAAHGQVGHWRDSLAVHERIIALNPHHYRSLDHLGKAYQRLGRFDEALGLFRAAIRSAPTWPPPRIGIADIAFMRGDLDEAIEFYEYAVELDPAQPAPHASLGRALAFVGRNTEARGHFERSIELEIGPGPRPPRAAVPHFGLGKLAVVDGEWSEAIASFERGLAIDPNDRDALTRLADLRASGGDVSAAVALLDRAESRGVGSARYYAARGKVAEAAGDVAGALDNFRIALTVDSEHHDAARAVAWLIARHPGLAPPEDAVRVAEAAVTATQRSDPRMLDALGAAYAASDRYDEATAAAEEAVRLASLAGNREEAVIFRDHLERWALRRSAASP